MNRCDSDETASLFAAHGLRCTRQRLAIYQALRRDPTHPTADQIYQRVATEAPRYFGVSRATVYNTLEAFCQAGLARKLPGLGDNGSARYDAGRGDHVHLRCEQTGVVTDLPETLSQRILDQLSPDLIDDISRQLGVSIREVQVELVAEPKAK